MTRAKLTIEGDDPIEIDFDVREGMEAVLVVISTDEVKIHSKDEPRLVSPTVCKLCGDRIVWDEGNGGQWLGTDPPRDWMNCYGDPTGPKHTRV